MKINPNTSSRIARSTKGVGIIMITTILAVFAVFPLGLLGFELARYGLMCQQLANVTQAAALAGTAALASSPQGYTYADLQVLAMQTARDTFEQNSILQTNFSPNNVTASLNEAPLPPPDTPHRAVLNMTLLDQDGNPKVTGDPLAKTIRIKAIYADSPVFACPLLPLQHLVLATALASAGLPKVDLFLVFDCSGSMDDETSVVTILRAWNGNDHRNTYIEKASGTISEILGPPPTGTGVNATWPQNLAFCAVGGSSGHAHPQVWSETPTAPNNKLVGLRAHSGDAFHLDGAFIEEQGRPPGNYDLTDENNTLMPNGYDPFTTYATGFTDLVVEVPDDDPNFPLPNNVARLEASHGNLDSDEAFTRSKASTAPELAGFQAKPGYYNSYWQRVRQTAQPISAARQAAANFFSTMFVSSNCHFGFVAFADQRGQSPTDVWYHPENPYFSTNENIDINYPFGGINGFPLPLVDLDQNDPKFNEVIQAINGAGAILPLGATGGTNIVDPGNFAGDSLTNPTKFREGAKEAMIVFTDGTPNLPGGSDNARQQCFNLAYWAHSVHLPIYTIGLSQNSQVKPLEDSLLGDGSKGDGSDQGMAYISGNGAIYTSVTDHAQLNDAFQTIARSLVVLQ